MTITLDLAPTSEELLSDLAGPDEQDQVKIASSLLATALEQAAHKREEGAGLAGLKDSEAGRMTPRADWEVKFRAVHSLSADTDHK